LYFSVSVFRSSRIFLMFWKIWSLTLSAEASSTLGVRATGQPKSSIPIGAKKLKSAQRALRY
jgi:hypothetical protein